MTQQRDTTQPAGGSPVERGVGRLEPERARLSGDVARCPGYSADGEWRVGCEDCLRRTAPPADPERVWMMAPPAIIVECESRIAA